VLAAFCFGVLLLLVLLLVFLAGALLPLGGLGVFMLPLYRKSRRGQA